MVELPFATSDTELAAYLIQLGFILLKIQYEPRFNGKQRGIFIFEGDPKIEEFKNLKISGQASGNLADFNRIKSDLIERIIKGLP